MKLRLIGKTRQNNEVAKLATTVVLPVGMSILLGLAIAQPTYASSVASPGVSFKQTSPVSLQSSKPAEQEQEQKEAKLDLSFNGSSEEVEPGFLYFNQHSTNFTTLNTSIGDILALDAKPEESFTPRFGKVVSGAETRAILGDDWLKNSFTPRQADAHLSFGYQPGDEEGSKIGVAISSSVQLDDVNLPGVVNNPSLTSAFNRQTYRLGLDVGYSGFNIGASLREDQSAYADTTRGYGVGLSYRSTSWSTSLNVGEYSRKNRNVFDNFGQEETNFYAFELGASYVFNPSLSLSGGVRYLTFGDGDGKYSLVERPETQVFYLGTNFSF